VKATVFVVVQDELQCLKQMKMDKIPDKEIIFLTENAGL
jgi:hypothetical protein